MTSDAGAGLRLALGTLTVVPVGDIGTPTSRQAGWAMTLAPVGAVPVAAGVAVVAGVGEATHLPTLVRAGLVLAAVALGSRAMHLDGLADTIDGWGASWSRERALEVMKRGDVGPMGAAGLVLVLLVQAGALAALLGSPWGWAPASVAVLASRAACAVTCARGIRSARPDGMGAVVAGSVPRLAAAAVLVLVVLLLTVTGVLASSWSPLTALLAVVALAGTALLVVRSATRAFGGVTGDVLGAAIELALAALLTVLVAGLR